MNFDLTSYETLDDISKRTGIPVARLIPIAGRKIAFKLNNVTFYEAGWNPEEFEPINKGQGLGMERDIYRFITCSKSLEKKVSDYLESKEFDIKIDSTDHFRYITMEDEYVDIMIRHCKRSQLKALNDIPKWMGHKFVSKEMSYLFENRHDFDALKELRKKHNKTFTDATFVDLAKISII